MIYYLHPIGLFIPPNSLGSLEQMFHLGDRRLIKKPLSVALRLKESTHVWVGLIN